MAKFQPFTSEDIDFKGTGEDVDRIARQLDSTALYHVLDPISLLACKLELVAKIPQKNRQDVAHLRILVPCVREFLAELLEQVTPLQLSARDWLKVVQRVLKLTRHSRALKLGRKHGIKWVEILPLAAVAQCEDQIVRRFYELQCSGKDAR